MPQLASLGFATIAIVGSLVNIPAATTLLMALSTLAALSGSGAAFLLYWRPSSLPATIAGNFRSLHSLLLNRGGFDELYDLVIVLGAGHPLPGAGAWKRQPPVQSASG